MTPVNSTNFVRVLYGAPLAVVLVLAVRGRCGQRELVDEIGRDAKTVRSALDALCAEFFIDGQHPVVLRHDYRSWRLHPGSRQLPLPAALAESGKIPLSAGDRAVDNLAESGKIPLSAGDRAVDNPAESGKIPLSGAKVVHLLEEDRKILDPMVPGFLDSVGVVLPGGAVAGYRLAEVVAAWWYVQSLGWVRSPAAMLYTHLRTRRDIPGPWCDLAVWFLGSSLTEHEQARDAIGGYAEWPLEFPPSARRIAPAWSKICVRRG